MTIQPESEEHLLRCVIELAHLRGWICAHFRPAIISGGWRTPVQADGKGFPDLVMIRTRDGVGRMVVAELKSAKGVLRPEQERWIDAMRGAGVETYVWRPGDWELIERVLE